MVPPSASKQLFSTKQCSTHPFLPHIQRKYINAAQIPKDLSSKLKKKDIKLKQSHSQSCHETLALETIICYSHGYKMGKLEPLTVNWIAIYQACWPKSVADETLSSPITLDKTAALSTTENCCTSERLQLNAYVLNSLQLQS